MPPPKLHQCSDKNDHHEQNLPVTSVLTQVCSCTFFYATFCDKQQITRVRRQEAGTNRRLYCPHSPHFNWTMLKWRSKAQSTCSDEHEGIHPHRVCAFEKQEIKSIERLYWLTSKLKWSISSFSFKRECAALSYIEATQVSFNWKLISVWRGGKHFSVK